MPQLILIPDGPGDVFDWASAPGGIGWKAVQDYFGPDGDTTFASSGGGGRILVTAHAPGDIRPVASVAWVGVQAVARLRPVPPPTDLVAVAPTIRSGGIDYVGAPFELISSFQTIDPADDESWRTFTDPGTGQRWTMQSALDAQFGLVDESVDTEEGHSIRCTMLRKLIWVEWVVGGGNAVRGDLHG